MRSIHRTGDYWLYFWIAALPPIISATWLHPVVRDIMLAGHLGLTALKAKRSGNGKKEQEGEASAS